MKLPVATPDLTAEASRAVLSPIVIQLAKAVLAASEALNIDMGDGELTYQCCNAVCGHSDGCLIGNVLQHAKKITNLDRVDLLAMNLNRSHGMQPRILTEQEESWGSKVSRALTEALPSFPEDVRSSLVYTRYEWGSDDRGEATLTIWFILDEKKVVSSKTPRISGNLELLKAVAEHLTKEDVRTQIFLRLQMLEEQG